MLRIGVRTGRTVADAAYALPASGERLRKNLRQPIRTLRAPAIRAIVGHVIAVLDQQEGARPFDFPGQPLGMLPGDQAVELAGHHENRTRDVLRHAFQREVRGAAIGLLLRGAMAAHAEGLARQIRETGPRLLPIVGTAERDAGLDALLEGGRARRVIAAEAHAPQ